MKNISSNNKEIFATLAFVMISLIASAQAGTLDSTFGVNGVVHQNVVVPSGHSNCLAIQADGKIVIAGSFIDSAAHSHFELKRFNSDGSSDLSFGNNGASVISFDSWPDAEGSSLAIQPDGKVIVTGRCIIWNYYG